MTTGALLDALIEIAGISKSEFATDTFITPSSLSLILSGKRLPGLKDKEVFCKRSASVLTEHIYKANCFPKFKQIFPVIYDFNSQHELETFLQLALEYFIDLDQALANDQDLDYPDHGKLFLGDMRILNYFCVTLSDYFQRQPETDLVVFSSLPIFSHDYPPFLRRMRFAGNNGDSHVKLHQAIFPLENDSDQLVSRPVDTIFKIQDFCDLNFWQAEASLKKNYVLLKDHVLIFFDQLLDQSWSMTVLEHKNHVNHLYEEIKTRLTKQMSFNRQQFQQQREQGKNCFKELLEQKISRVFNFVPIAYMVNDKELAKIEDSAEERRIILAFFEKILSEDTRIYFSDLCFRTIADEGKLAVPLHGLVELPPSDRIPYLNRIVNYYEGNSSHDKFKLIYINAPRMCLICSPELSLIYTVDYNFKNEKVHFFHKKNLCDSFLRQIENEAVEIAAFSMELWDDFLQNRL